MHTTGILTGEIKTGRGGHYFIYKIGMDETAFKRFVAETIITSLMRDFPEETTTAITKINSP